MTGSTDHIRGALVAPLRRSGWKLAALVAVLVVLGSSSIAMAAFGAGGGAGKFAATFEARAGGDPMIDFCRGLGLGGQKLEGRYEGTMTIDGAEYGIHFVLEALVDRSAGLGSAEGHWQLTDPRTEDVVGRGELLATVTGDPPSESDPPTEADPPSELELHGMLIGAVNPPDPDLPAQKLLGNFSASLGDGATFPHLKGTVGDPTVGDPTVGDPTEGELLPAILIASDPC